LSKPSMRIVALLLGCAAACVCASAPAAAQGSYSPYDESATSALARYLRTLASDPKDFSALIDYRNEFQLGALRYDVGEPANFALLPPAVVALEQLMAWGIPAIYETIGALVDEIVARGRSIGLTAVPDQLRARHYVGLRSARPLPADLPEQLARERVHVSLRGGQSIRITPHLYNDRRDIDRLFACLEPVVS